MGSKFTGDFYGIGKMLTADFMVAEMKRRAERVMALAIATAPTDVRDKDGEYYRDHFKVESGVRRRVTNRAYGRVVNDHSAALSIEFGTGDPKGHRTPRHRTLGNALSAAGE